MKLLTKWPEIGRKPKLGVLQVHVRRVRCVLEELLRSAHKIRIGKLRRVRTRGEYCALSEQGHQ